ncbi:Transposable element Tcb2 transposase [Rhizoctonia solani]|uniref:Transposable element Tcb2 transposase n=1 Tax=Rhizoctonia solani TaxID=456999 RepID=A0A8H8SX77_9AGAM|nr:Transposable element Tcb2 transposase [Rhizoctonia solani]QRW21104.1 Transposable element Tcb2 transposase [Rhizoctonia solani]
MPPRGQQHSPELRAQILALRDLGLTIYKIATQLNVPPSTVSRTCTRYLKTRSYYSDRSRSGRPRKLRFADAKFAALSLSRNRLASASQLRRDYFSHVSNSTVRRRLRELGIYNYARRRVPLLTSRHLKARLDWARNHATWLARDWRRVIFSDESKFNVFNGDGPLRCWRRPGLSLDPCYTRKQVKHGGGNVMVWGCVTANGVGRLYRIDGHLTAVHYTKILKEELRGTMADLSIPVRRTVFQHDNDPKHTAKLTQEWLNTQQLSVLPWPANSPDMNIIENVWDYLDRRVRMRHQLPTRANDLWAILQEEWECIPQAYVDKLYDSMTERVQEVIDRKGGNTRY